MQTTNDHQTAATSHQGRSGGAPVENRNRMRHGLRSSRLPAGCARIGRDLSEFRRALEDGVLSVRERVTQTDAAQISEAIEHERHRRLCLRWLAIDFENLSHSERIRYSGDAAKASTERNRAIERLKIDAVASDLWATIYGAGSGNELQQPRAKSFDADNAPNAEPSPAATEGPQSHE